MLCGSTHCSHFPQVYAHCEPLHLVVDAEVFTQEVCLHRFGSFEIFKQADEFTGRQGPSYGRDEIRGQMMDYVIEMFYPEIQQNYPDRVERNVAFFREVSAVTAEYFRCKAFI